MFRRFCVLLLLAACPPEPKFPGDELMGTFQFEAVARPSAGCTLEEVPDGGFTFTGTFSRQSDGGGAWLTVNGFQRDAVFDGQRMASTRIEPRTFNACACVPVRVEETLHVALLSRSQNDAVGDQCPQAPLDGGTPPPDEDGGITHPQQTDRGFDAVRACGELLDVVIPEVDPSTLGPDAGCNACPYPSCTLQYDVRGVRL